MDKKLLLFSVGIALLLMLSGCIQPNKSTGCCARATINKGCILDDGTNLVPLTKTCNDEFCDLKKLDKDGKPVLDDKGKEIIEQVPVCSDRKQLPCEDPSCTAMVCGPYIYNPGPVATANDVNQSTADKKQAGQLIGGLGGESGAKKLYKATCQFISMGPELSTLMQNTKGSFLNTFRFGVGGSYAEYDSARYFFPISDRFCSQNNIGKVDRFENYLAPATLKNNPGNVRPESLFPEESCVMTNGNLPEPFDTSSSGGTKGNYKMSSQYTGVQVACDLTDQDAGKCANPFPVERYVPKNAPSNIIDLKNYEYGKTSEITEKLPEFLNIQGIQNILFISNRSVIDKDFYKQALQWLYFDSEINKGKQARFECSQSDCLSGSCDTSSYKRSVCQKLNGDAANCLCEEKGNPEETQWIECVPGKDYRKADTIGSGLTYTPINTNVYAVSVTFAGATPKDKGADCGNAPDPATKATIQNAGYQTVEDETTSAFFTSISYAKDTVIKSKYYKECNAQFIYGFAYPAVAQKKPAAISVDCTQKDGDQCKQLSTTIKDSPLQALMPPASSIYLYKEPRIGQIPPFIKADTSFIGYAVADNYDFANSQLVKSCNMKEGKDYVTLPTWNLINAPRTYNYKDPAQQKTDPTILFGTPEVDTDNVPTGYLLEPWVLSYSTNLYDAANTNKYTPLQVQIPTAKYNDEYYFGEINNNALRKISDNGGDVLGSLTRYGRKNPYLVSSYFIPIKSLGDCQVDAKGSLKLTTYGWCEACTYSTLAYQKIKTEGYRYAPIAQAKEEDIKNNNQFNWQPICLITARDACGFGHNPYVSASIEYCNSALSDVYPQPGKTCSLLPQITQWPRISPDASYLQSRSDAFLKSDVMPIIDASDESNWQRTRINQFDIGDSQNHHTIDFLTNLGGEIIKCDTCGGSFCNHQICDAWMPNDRNFISNLLLKTGNGRGPFIVIVTNLDATTDINAVQDNAYQDLYGVKTIKDSISKRLQDIRKYCPKCLTAIHISNGAMGTNTREQRSTKDFGTIDKLFGMSKGGDSCYGHLYTCDDAMLQNVDIIAYDYYPSELVNSHNYKCDGTEDQYRTVTDDMAGFSRSILYKYRKPSLIVNFSIPENLNGNGDACWAKTGKYDSLKGLFNYIFINQRDFVKAGTIGLLYPDYKGSTGDPSALTYTSPDDPNDLKADKFCALQQGSKYLIAQAPTFIFRKAVASSPVFCSACTIIDKLTGDCKKTCANGIDCKVPDGLPPEVNPNTDLRCPLGVIADDPKAQLCVKSADTLSCTYTYIDGSSKSVDYNLADITKSSPDDYADVISSMPYGKLCLIESGGIKYTYIKTDISASNNAPIIFSKKGIAGVDCGLLDVKNQGAFCAVQIPLKNYKLDCKIK